VRRRRHELAIDLEAAIGQILELDEPLVLDARPPALFDVHRRAAYRALGHARNAAKIRHRHIISRRNDIGMAPIEK
jgi:hypothetical protein